MSKKKELDALEAVKVIKTVCREKDDCSECPFSKGKSCLIITGYPEDWSINANELSSKALV